VSGVCLEPAQIRHQLAVRGLCASDLAKLAGVSPPTVSQALRGRAVSPRTVRALVLALASVPELPGHEGLIAQRAPVDADEECQHARSSR
jgi:transcriptional regulator with XRE-family HTH domain